MGEALLLRHSDMGRV